MSRVQLLLAALSAVQLTAAGDSSLLAGSLENCGRELGTCLRARAVTLLDRALHSGPIQINDYISLVPTEDWQQREDRSLAENEVEKPLLADGDDNTSALDNMIADKMISFISSRSLRLNFPTNLAEGRKSSGGGGGKKGGGMLLMAGMAMAGMMVQMAMAKIALLAGKALLIGKMALLLSAIIGLKKLVGGGGGESHQVVYATEGHGGGGHGWGRSSPDAHRLAYSAQTQLHSQ